MPTNLFLPQAIKTQLLTAFAADRRLDVRAVSGPIPGRSYYAYLPATRTYWALAYFEPSGAGADVGIAFQDSGGRGLFSRQDGQPWKVSPTPGGPWPCPGDLDPALEKVWNMPADGYCQVIAVEAPSSAPESQYPNDGNGNVANGTYSGKVSSLEYQLGGAGYIQVDDVVSSGSPTVSGEAMFSFDTSTKLVPGSTGRAWADALAGSLKAGPVPVTVVVKRGTATSITVG